VAAVLIFAVAVPVSGWLWGRIVNALHPVPPVSAREAAAVHSLSWLLKYIPGQVGSLLSKVMWGSRTGRSRMLIVITFIYENVFLQLASIVPSAIILVLTLGFTAVEGNALAVAIPLALIVLVVIVMRPRIFHALMSLVTKRVTKSELPAEYFLSTGSTVRLSLGFLVPRILNGIGFVFVASSFLEVTPEMWLPLAAIYVLAGAIGILAVFVPSGLGVREAVIFTFAVQLVSPAEAVLLALLSRLLSTLADAVVAVIYLVLRVPAGGAAEPEARIAGMAGGRRWMLLAVLAAVVVVNLVQFRSIDTALGGVGYAALGRQPTSDIMTLGRVNSRIDGTYGMYLDLREASPRSHVTGARNGPIKPSDLRDTALSLGDAATVTIGDFDDTAAPLPEELLALGGAVAAQGSVTVDGRDDVPWQLITSDCGVDPGPTEGRELVIVSWNSGMSLSVGLVESCLLPDGFAGEPA